MRQKIRARRQSACNRNAATKNDRTTGSRSISRVLSAACAVVTVIPLGVRLPARSSHLPASSAGHVVACLFGVAPGGGCRVSPHLIPLPEQNGLVSVALFLASRRTAVNRHPALWSPDFPLSVHKCADSDCLTDSRENCTMGATAPRAVTPDARPPCRRCETAPACLCDTGIPWAHPRFP